MLELCFLTAILAAKELPAEERWSDDETSVSRIGDDREEPSFPPPSSSGPIPEFAGEAGGRLDPDTGAIHDILVSIPDTFDQEHCADIIQRLKVSSYNTYHCIIITVTICTGIYM